MASTETDVGNAALFKLGERPVLSFSDQNDRARNLLARFADIRDDELRAYRWQFALKRARLSALAEAPVFGFELQFELPADYLHLVEIGGQDVAFSLADALGSGGAAFAIEGRRILTDLEAPLDIRYICREPDVSAWDACFVEAVACRLAMELAEPLTQSDTKRLRATQAYGSAIQKARRINAIERPSEAAADDSWIAGRR